MHDPSFNARNMASQRLPTRLTGPPRFIGAPGVGVRPGTPMNRGGPGRTPTPGAPTPGVTTARATGRGRSTTPGLTMHPAGYETYWQYTTAPASSVLAAMSPVMSSADIAIESFIVVSSRSLGQASSRIVFLRGLASPSLQCTKRPAQREPGPPARNRRRRAPNSSTQGRGRQLRRCCRAASPTRATNSTTDAVAGPSFHDGKGFACVHPDSGRSASCQNRSCGRDRQHHSGG